MADEKDDKPVEPIVRKKEDEAEEADEETSQEQGDESAEAPAPAPTPPPEQPAPEPASEEAPEAPAEPAVAEQFDQDKPVPALSRRVVDMKTYKPKPKKKTEPDPMLVEKKEDEGESSNSTTSPERPSVKSEKAQVRVEAGSLEDFEAMLAGEGATPKRQRVEIGEKYEGLVTSVGDRWIYVDLGSGNEGLARVADFTDKEGNISLEAGDRHEFYVLSVDEGGTISLGDQLSTREAAMDAIYTALDTGAPLQGRVAQKNKGGFEIELGGVRAFCPISQIELGYTEDAEEHVGKAYKFRVTEIREDGKSIVVSRAALLREEQAAQAEETLQKIATGMTVEGQVTRVADFGAFVDIGGVEGLVHISEMGFGHVDHPSEVVKKDEHVQVKILKIDRESDEVRIGLSMKETMEDPWEGAVRDLHVGKKVTGTVTRLEPFGAFVEVLPHVEGLVHVSEMSWEKHVKNPSDVVSTGQQITVEVQDIDLARRRISLSMKAAEGDPWNDIEERYSVGQEVTGTVENVEDFGAFVSLGSGIDALIPRSEMGLGRGATPHSRFSQGNEVTARVLSIEPDRRRMALTMKSAEEVADSAGSGQKSWSEGSKGLGTLGDLLKDKLEDS